MRKGIRFTDEFKKDSVPHVRAEVLDQVAEIRRLKRELAGVTEGRTILKRRPCTSREGLSEVRVYRDSP